MVLKKHINKSDFVEFINFHRKKEEKEFFLSKTRNKIFRASLDSEHRIFDLDIQFEDHIVELPFIRLRNSETITIKNCVFLCSINISSGDGVLKSIHIEDSIFLRDFSVIGLDANTEINIFNSNFTRARFVNNNIPDLDIRFSRFYSLQLGSNTIKYLRTRNNSIKYFSYDNNGIMDVSFDHRQIDLECITKKEYAIRRAAHVLNVDGLEINYLDIGSMLFKFISIDEDKMINNKDSKHQTMNFITDRTNIKDDQDSLVVLRYYKSLISNSGVSKLLFIFTYAFQSPIRIFGMIVSSIVLFSLLYYLVPWMQFKSDDVTTHLGFMDSLYYSGITFTTIGYGDISPVGLSKIVSIFEGILGILLTSSFVISLLRRHVD